MIAGRSLHGFTLIELMITVAVIGILASVALPSYNAYVRRGHRADAEAQLMNIANRQQQYLVDRRAYSSSITGTAASGGLAIDIPANVSKYYRLDDSALSVDNTATPPTFTVTARPLNDQQNDTCGYLRIDQSGNKSAEGTGTCW